MGRASVGQAKNVVTRALRAILDRELTRTEEALVWRYFKSACAYCGLRLWKKGRKGHLDHLVHGGTNHISNRVLSCGVCNGDEKRDRPWRAFIKEKASSPGTLAARRRLILEWVKKHKPSHVPHGKERLVEREIKRVVAQIDQSVLRLRAHRVALRPARTGR